MFPFKVRTSSNSISIGRIVSISEIVQEKVVNSVMPLVGVFKVFQFDKVRPSKLGE